MATNLVRSSNPLPTCGAWRLQKVIESFFGRLSPDTLGNKLAAGLSGRGAGRAHVDQLRVGPLGHLFPESDAALCDRLDALFVPATERGRNTAG
jgi:hypothetical protein